MVLLRTYEQASFFWTQKHQLQYQIFQIKIARVFYKNYSFLLSVSKYGFVKSSCFFYINPLMPGGNKKVART